MLVEQKSERLTPFGEISVGDAFGTGEHWLWIKVAPLSPKDDPSASYNSVRLMDGIFGSFHDEYGVKARPNTIVTVRL